MYSLVSLVYYLARRGGRLPHEVLRTLFFIFAQIILESETLKSPAQLWYKIHILYIDHTKKTIGHRNKCCEYFRPEGVLVTRYLIILESKYQVILTKIIDSSMRPILNENPRNFTIFALHKIFPAFL